jgi:competence protein ComEC
MPAISDREQATRLTYFPLALVVCALAAGIAVDRGLSLPAALWWCAALGLLAAWVVAWQAGRDRLGSSLLLAAVFATGGAWHHVDWHVYRTDEISRMLHEQARPACVEAVALTSPRWVPAPTPTALRTIPQEEKSELLIWITGIRDGQQMRRASGSASLDVGGTLDSIRAGDRTRVFVQASRPASPLNPGEFDFAAHERSQRLGCRLFAEFPASVELVRRGSAWSPRRWLADARSGGVAVLRRFISGERARLAAAVLLGAREQLDADRNEGYLVTGTVHVLSISGLHVGILAAAFFLVLRTGLLPRRATLAATMLLVVAYALLTDLQPPVVRAAILVVIGCLAMWVGRAPVGWNTLAAAGLVVLIINPSALFLAGPQLSFLAVATMIAFQSWLVPQPIVDPLDRLIATTRPWVVRSARWLGLWLWRLWLTGALIWLVSTPLVWKQYNLISPAALLLNFLMWLPVTVAMYCGLGTLVFGSIAPMLARVFGRACDESFALLEKLIAWGEGLAGGHFWLPAPPAWWVAVFYIGLAVAVLASRRLARRWTICLAAIWLAGALLLAQDASVWLPRRGPRPLVCHFVAVGHGISVLVELPDGRNLLYDSGRLGSPLAGVRPISAVLWSRGIRHLDAVVISHADADHFNAIPGLLDRFSVGALYVSPVMFRRQPPAVRELSEAIARSGAPLRELYGGQRLAAGAETRIEVLHPPRAGVFGSDNANSIVLLIEHAGKRILLTGDLEPPGLDDVLAEEPLDCDVVLAPHHGSPRSSPGPFAEWCLPEHVIISGRRGVGDDAVVEGVKNSFRLRGAEVYHTAEDGCTRVEISTGKVAVTTFRPHVRAAARGADAKFLQSD